MTPETTVIISAKMTFITREATDTTGLGLATPEIIAGVLSGVLGADRVEVTGKKVFIMERSDEA